MVNKKSENTGIGMPKPETKMTDEEMTDEEMKVDQGQKINEGRVRR